VVVVARLVTGDRTELLVAPVTHSEPSEGEGIEIPPRVKQHLGLDDKRSWIVSTELNRFVWPGPDIRIVPGGDEPLFGAIPGKLFELLRARISDHAAANRMRVPRRSE